MSNDSPVLSPDQAKEYDFHILIDKSGSMSSPSTKMEGKSRWGEAQEFTEALARFVEQFDADGLTVITFNSSHTLHDGVKSDKVSSIFTSESPSGSTNLAGALKAAFDKKFSGTKPTIIVVLTDGAPDSQSDVKTAIIEASHKLEKDADLAIQFVQIGDDSGASKFLADLDDNLKGAKFDIVNSLTREQAESLSIKALLWQAIND